jgi:hypothetical protein
VTAGRPGRVISLTVVAWADIAGGTLWFTQVLIRLTIGRAKPEMTAPGARSSAWQSLLASVMVIAIGVVWLAGWWNVGAARWLLGSVGCAALIWFLVADLGSWRRSRLRRKSGAPAADPASPPH